MKNFLQKISYLGLNKNHKLLLAVSGGVDSMVLLDLLNTFEFTFSIAHCNFSLRGKESAGDELFIRSICEKQKLELFVKKFNTIEYAKKKQFSIQMAARELRYNWFELLITECNFDYILTAHHSDDSVETFLINLIRGTGFSGLHGIKMINNNVIRPLLAFSKQNIIDYAQNNKIEYRTDSSNAVDYYVRNKIRNNLIPIMQEINPSVLSSISKTISKVNAVEELYQKLIEEKKKTLIIKKNNEYYISVKKLLKEVYPKQLLYEIISDFGFLDTDAVFNSLSSISGKEFFNTEFYMIKDRDRLIVTKHIDSDIVVIEEDTVSISHPFKITFTSSVRSDLKLTNNKNLYIDQDKLEFPLLLRPWKEGDRFVPLGMNKFKKISDYFIDNKFSLIKKKQTRLLISNENIVGVVGERLDDRFKLVENSKKVYIVKV